MHEDWELLVYEGDRLADTVRHRGPLELGRQDRGEPAPSYLPVPRPGGPAKLVVAPKDLLDVSRRHVLVEPLPGARFRLTNLSEALPLRLEGGAELPRKTAREFPAPAGFSLGKLTLRAQARYAAEDSGEHELKSLSEVTLAPGEERPFAAPVGSLMFPAGQAVEMEAVVHWLQATLSVLQGAANSLDFFPRAARALVELVGLDSGRVLLLQGDRWGVQAVHTAVGLTVPPGWQPSRQVMARLVGEKRTFWQSGAGAAGQESLAGVDAVVAAPILDRQRQVIGALYGDRKRRGAGAATPISRAEAMLVEVLATGVAAGLARLTQEQAAARARVQFEEFFSPELAHHLALQPDLLRGRDLEVSILFCDIRGFSRISERLGTAGTFEWIGSAMGALSECVHGRRGVVVDYIGDELMAMWGAPQEQPDHAELACRAALDMLDRLPALNDRWQATLGEPLRLGIGINTGPARVGNAGSPNRFKYGPLGNTVNLASRVQGASRYLRSPLLITEATRSRLDPAFAVRRLCRARVVNIAEPVALYELVLPAERQELDFRAEYETALEKFEAGNFRTSVRILGNILSEHSEDRPSLVLLARAVQCLVNAPPAFDPVWELTGK